MSKKIWIVIFRYLLAIGLFAIYYAVFENQNHDLVETAFAVAVGVGIATFRLKMRVKIRNRFKKRIGLESLCRKFLFFLIFFYGDAF